LVEQVIAGRYRLGALLGVGGMARVVAAHDLRLDRRVAVKLAPASGIDRAGRERFVREARSSAGFSHPNAVAVFDAGEADGYLYLVMELVDGPSVATRLAEHGPLDVDDAVTITTGVLAALGAAHAAGIVHRDVKPGNVLLGPGGAVKLADFGIAKRLGDLSADLTGTGQFIGTPKYLAPEQVLGEPVSPATDLYAVGVVLYEMLAGRPPFEADTPIATAIAHRDAPIPDVRDVRPDVPEHVAAAITRAMAKDPRKRFGSAEQMAATLSGLPEPVPAVVPLVGTSPPVEPTQVMVGRVRPSRRSRAWWWAVAAVLAVAIGAVIALAQRDDEPNASARDRTSTTVPRAANAPGTRARPATTAAPTTATPSTTATPTTPPPTTSPPTTAPPTVPPAPASLEELIAFVEADPDRFGEKGTAFLDELRKVEEESGRKQADKAAELLDRAQEQVDKGELSPELLAIAEPVLLPIAEGPGEDDHGPGPGGEGGEGEG
jgi:eukaryotic-like serine/threonine-protein kinase